MDAQVSVTQAPAGAPARPRARVPDPVAITKTLCWLIRDRGTKYLTDLHGVSRLELETAVLLRKFKPAKAYASFDESLAAAIEHGWIEAYRADGRLRYCPNYKRGADREDAP